MINSPIFQLKNLISEKMGLFFPEERFSDFEKGIGQAAKELGFNDVETCVQSLLTSPLSKKQIQILARYLVVGETYFFREPKTMEVLEKQILPELISLKQKDQKHIRIWSSGCATGEEAYSAAILLHRLLPDFDQWDIQIIGTDLYSGFLRKAAFGSYTTWSFREALSWDLTQYFTKANSGWRIIPCLKKKVAFKQLNLADEQYPSPFDLSDSMDLIFCRNVLMYFSAEKTKQIVRRFYSSLVQGGWLVVSPAELSQTWFSQFEPISFHGTTVYRKRGSYSCIKEDQAVLESEKPSELEKFKFQVQSQEKKFVEGKFLDKIRELANQGKLKEALLLSSQGIKEKSLNKELYIFRAAILQELNQMDEAAQSLNKLLSLDPEYVMAYFSLGSLAVKKGKLQEGRKWFKQVLRLLANYGKEDQIPGSEEMSAAQLKGITVKLMREKSR
ncbi:MAG: hypothetical protein M1421_02370 [Candidatus Eremiobacteraeota bacterium]|nr:hypothetical protein [Candidatus Eremiobacteraeota bacterium]